MRVTATTVARRCLLGTWVVLFAVVVGFVMLSRLGPLAGIEPIVIRSGSMAPEMPVGSLVLLRSGASETVEAGNVVTLRLRNGQLLTHRVVRTARLPDGLYIETKGDANDEPDPVLMPVTSVVGIATDVVPNAGYLLAYLSLPTGMASVSSFLAALLLTAWLFEEPGRSRSRPARPLQTGAATP